MKPSAKYSAKQKREERTRKRKLGYVLKQIWVLPKEWERVKEFIFLTHLGVMRERKK